MLKTKSYYMKSLQAPHLFSVLASCLNSSFIAPNNSAWMAIRTLTSCLDETEFQKHS